MPGAVRGDRHAHARSSRSAGEAGDPRRRRLRRTVAVSLAALVASGLTAGCGSGEERGSTAPAAPTAESGTWPGPAQPREDGTIAVAKFNEHVERADGAWTRSPLLVAIEFLGVEAPEAATTSIDVAASPEGEDEASVTVTLDGLLDDSVRSVRTVLALDRRADETWRLRSARREQRCWPERGHRELSPRPCV